MRPGDRELIPTVSEAVRDACAICDPEGADTVVTALFEAFEDDDRPATASEDLGGELLETVRGIDPDGLSGAAQMAAAAAVWLATNPSRADDHEHVLREGARLVFSRQPPAAADAWLAERGVSL